MKTQNLYFLLIFFLFSSCAKKALDRPPLTTIIDDNFWRNESDVRLFANGFYENYFIGYNAVQVDNYAPYFSSNFCDDLTRDGVQTNFENIVPPSRVSTVTGAGASWLPQHAGPTWNFTWVRKVNIFIDRLENRAKPVLTEEAYNHWIAVARFFRGVEYSKLVSVFGDIPYFDRVVEDTDRDYMYKDRDDRGLVMDRVYDDFQFALQNMRTNDGKQFLNRYVAAAFVSRLMLFEGSFLHYHGTDAARSRKYLELTQSAAELVMNSGQYAFTSDYKSLFASESLDGNKEVIMWRTYDEAMRVLHSLIARQDGDVIQQLCVNLNFVKSFPCIDGQPWQNSSTPDASSFSIPDLIKSRDPRFEATILDVPRPASQSLFYSYKHAPRDIKNFIGGSKPIGYAFERNTNDAPVIRLAEVVLNWVEAKAILAEGFGGAAISQGDLDNSINAIRNRPLAAQAIALGVQKTSPLLLASMPDDPDRDPDITALMWEIRRERRIEFYLEQTRLLDLKRWKKMNYMDFSSSPDYFLGAWVDVQADLPALLIPSRINILKVRKEDGTVVTYDGSNASEMVGYFVIPGAVNRQPFTDKVYRAPIGDAQIIEYTEQGYKLTQTVNW